jgi:chromosome segregation ATPase
MTGEMRERQRAVAFLCNATAALGLIVLGFPLAPATIRATLLGWILTAVAIARFTVGRFQISETRTQEFCQKERTLAKNTSIRNLLLTASCSLALTLVAARAGATENTFKQSAELKGKTAKTSKDIDKYVAQLDKTEQVLAAVGQAGGKELKKQYESFSREVKELEEAQKHATSDIDEMKSTGAEYFTSWDASIAQMSNPDLKQASAERRSKVMKDHDELAATLSDVGSHLQPFMSNLQDLKSFLGTDLSSVNVGKAGDMIQKSQADAQALKTKITGVQTTLKQFLGETTE